MPVYAVCVEPSINTPSVMGMVSILSAILNQQFPPMQVYEGSPVGMLKTIVSYPGLELAFSIALMNEPGIFPPEPLLTTNTAENT